MTTLSPRPVRRYVCMYVSNVCMHVSMHCMYVCMYAHTHTSKAPTSDMVCVDLSMYICMYICMYVLSKPAASDTVRTGVLYCHSHNN